MQTSQCLNIACCERHMCPMEYHVIFRSLSFMVYIYTYKHRVVIKEVRLGCFKL